MAVIKTIVQEWMQEEENKEILECISECDDKREARVSVPPVQCREDEYYEENTGTGDGTGACVKKPDVDACKEPLDIIFLVDGSDSIRKDDWPLVGNWTNNLLEMVKPLERAKDTKVIYQQYSSSSYFPDAIIQTIPTDRSQMHGGKPKDAAMLYAGLRRDIENQEQRSQGTDTYHALNELNEMFKSELRSTKNGMKKNGEDDGITTVLITLTDGAARDRAKNRKESVMQEIRQRVDSKLVEMTENAVFLAINFLL